MTGLEPTDGPLTYEELALAARNRGMPLEALRYDITPAGLHYLLIHFDIPDVDESGYRLEVGGAVERPLNLSMDEIRAMPRQTHAVTLECAGNGRARFRPRPVSQPWLYEAVSTAEWSGTPLRGVLEASGLAGDAVEVVLTGADRGSTAGAEHAYERSLTIGDATRDEVLLAYEMNGRPLEPQHGAPLRVVVPGWYGMTSVKWLTAITAVTEPFTGFEQSIAYRLMAHAEDWPGEAVTRIRVRALMIPPGTPDFMTRARTVEAGRVPLRGRAWCGTGAVARVEVGVNGSWADAVLDDPIGPHAWRGWSWEWDAAPGQHVLACRATAEDGTVQPVEQQWNYQGMANNLIQTVDVTVR